MNLKLKIELIKPSELLKNEGEIHHHVKLGVLKKYAESKFFPQCEYPITLDDTLISHIEDVRAEMQNGDEPIWVLVVENLDEYN